MIDAPIEIDIKLFQLGKNEAGEACAEVEPIPEYHPAITAELMEKNAWSLSPDDYKLPVVLPPREPGACPMVRLGDICKFEHGASITKSKLKDGPYPVVGGGKKPLGYHSEFNTEANQIIISATGSAGWISRYNTPIFRNQDALTVVISDHLVLDNTYLYHLLSSELLDQLTSMRKGMAQPHFDTLKCQELFIPLPSLEIQQDIAKEMDAMAQRAETFETAHKDAKEMMTIAFENAIYKYGHLGVKIDKNRELIDGIVEMKLDDVFTITRGKFQASKNIPGDYTFVSVPKIFKSHNTFTHDGPGLVLVTSSVGCNGIVHFVTGKFASSTITVSLLPKKDINVKYAYYIMHSARNEIEKLQFGVKTTISTEKVRNIQIPIPSVELQQEIADRLDAIDQCAKTNKMLADKTRSDMKKMLNGFLQSGLSSHDQVQEPNLSDDIDIDV